MAGQLPCQGKEIGSVLIAVNSYTQPGTNSFPLLHADQILSDYIKTFHEFLFFKVTWLFDYTLEDFKRTFEQFADNSVGNHVAVVLYGHGAIHKGIERLGTKSDPLDIPLLEKKFAEQCPKKNRYLFLDLCRKKVVDARPVVYQVDTVPGTFIVHSTLIFHAARSNLWSRLMAEYLRDHADLTSVIDKVDDKIKLEYPSIPQASDVQRKGTKGTPNFRKLAKYENELQTRALTKMLGDAIQKAKKDMDIYRANQAPHNPPFVAPKLGSPTDTDPSNQPAQVPDLPIPQANQLQAPHNPPFVASKLGRPTDSSNQPAQVPDLPIPQAKQPPNNPLVASLGNPPDNPSNQPALDLPSAQGPRTVSKMDKEINILEILEFKDGLIGDMTMLATVLGLGQQADPILEGNEKPNVKLTNILKLYIKESESPTWRDLCTALKRLSTFNNIRAKIEKEHAK